MNINILIQQITPFYNKFKDNNISAVDQIKTMWDIGEILKEYIQMNDVAPHTLYRAVYGKSEGTENIIQKSYITREFLGRCYRVRNIFSTKDQITREFPNLKNFWKACMFTHI